jgi:DNA polymerase IV
MTRKIIHIDMDAFYASVEQRDDPTLKGKPIVVGGLPEERGVVCTASYEARKFGIRSAMPTKTALKRYPGLIIIRPNFRKYVKISDKLFEFYKEYTDLVESMSLDECYLDVTENKLNVKTATEIAFNLKNRIKRELNLTASVGVAPNKLLAKIASDINKPDGVFVIKPNQINEFMNDLSVGKLWGVGKVTFQKFKEMNILTCGELQKLPMIELLDKFGIFGETLYYFARGLDDRPVITEHEIKSIASEETFSTDIDDIELIKKALLQHTETVCERLIQNNLKAKTVTIKIKYFNFEVITRSKSLNYCTSDAVELHNMSQKLLSKTKAGIKKIRLIGVSLSNFSNEEQFFKEFC